MAVKHTIKTRRAGLAKTDSSADNPAQTWLLIGEDEFQLENLAREHIRRILSESEMEFGLETFDGAVDTVSAATELLHRVLNTLRTTPMFAARRVIWIRNAAFLDDGVISRGKNVLSALKEISDCVVDGFPPEQFLIVTAKKTPAKSPFKDTCAKHGIVVQQEQGKRGQRGDQPREYAVRAMREAGLSANAVTTRMLAERVGTDTRQIHQEVIKLSLFLGNRKTVTESDIEEIVSPTRDHFVYNLEDSVVKAQLLEAVKILRRLLFQKEDPIRILNALEARFRNLLVFREAINKGWIRPPTGRTFGAPALPPQLAEFVATDRRLANPYVRNILIRQAAGFKADDLLRAHDMILQTRKQVVFSSAPPALSTELLVIKLCQRN